MTDEQKNILSRFIENPSDDYDDLLLQIDAKITEIGFDQNYDLNEIGLELQRIYDEIYNQN